MMERDGRPQGPTHPHPRRPRPYYTTNRPAQPVYGRGRGGCGRGDGTLTKNTPHYQFSEKLSIKLRNVGYRVPIVTLPAVGE